MESNLLNTKIMERYGLIGHPLRHSYSQRYFTEKFHKEGLNCRYENFDIENSCDIPLLLIENPDIKGLNITAPYKEKALSYIDGFDTIVDEVKSTNTLMRFPNGNIVGFNTDVIGFATTLQQAFPNNDIPASALVLGTGGASKAVQYVLRHRQIPYRIVSRDPQKGDETYEGLSHQLMEQHLLIINSTPVGTYPHTEEAPSLPYDAIGPGHCLIDLVYNPAETLFLRRGKEKGARTVNGLTMLQAQAEASWQLWQTPFEKLKDYILFKESLR